MQRAGATPPTHNAALFFSSGNHASISNPFGGSSSNNNSSSSRSRPGTSSGEQQHAGERERERHNVLTRERRPSFSGARSRQRASSTGGRRPSISVLTSSAPSAAESSRAAVPPLPDFALAARLVVPSRDDVAVASPASVDSFSRMLSRTAPAPANGYMSSTTQLVPPQAPAGAAAAAAAAAAAGQGGQSESSMVHQHIQEMANKRISTLDYLRKAHEGRVYWFNTLLFDKPDLARMPYFDSRKLARRATNYLLLGLSLPTVIDLNSSTPLEFLRSLNTLLGEFESFQQLHSENGGSAGSLSRARLPQMFRRAAPGSKTRRTSGAANDIGYPLEPADSSSIIGGVGSSGSSIAPSTVGFGSSANASVISFAASETDLLPGEEYSHLLTPSLPFDPDFFETFATLCDVLIDCYTRLLSLLPTPRECTSPVAELFTKADARVRKIIIQGAVKEFEDSSRTGLKTEVANVGKVVLGGLM